MKISVKIHKFEGELWRYHLPIPTEVALKYISGTDKRVICHINETHTWQTALMKNAEYWFIIINQDIMDKCTLNIYQEVLLEIEKDTSTYGMEMPEELEAVLLQDDAVSNYFQQLTPGKQRNLIYIVNKVKSSDSRIKKALAIAFHLKATSGKINFKLLNQTIKQFNQNS